MKAARLEDGALHIRDLDIPDPGHEEALIRITSAGVCHSDLHIARGDWMGLPRSGVLGHEAIGVVEALGPGAERFVSVGDRVILGLGGTGGGYWCGACEFCMKGEPRHCKQGKGVMGVFSEYFTTFAAGVVTLPDSIGAHEAPLACGGLTAYGAVKKLLKHHVLPGRPIAVVGAAGGLGHYAVQIASAFGYRVVGIDVGASRLEFIKSLGAEYAVSPEDAPALVQSEFGGVDASLVFAARMAGFRLGVQLLRPTGLFVAVGLPASSEGNLELNPFELILKGITIIGSAVGTVQDMREVIDLAAAGRVRTHVDRTGPLSDLGGIFDDLEASKYLGRAVIDDLSH
jgi:propanol-preferring alcohol dehydrogenase